MNPIKVIIASNNYLLRTGMEALLKKSNDVTLVADASNEEELLNIISESKATVLVLDLSTITYSHELICKLKKAEPLVNILAFNNQQPKHFIAKALEQGITSYLMMHCDKEEITEALHKTAKGERFLCGQIVEILIGSSNKSQTHDANCPLYTYCGGVNLSDREMEIIKCVAEGHSNQEIADKLFLSVHTITTHRKNIMSKLGINNTARLVMYAVREQLVSSN
jgi:DNA-binding NarL/FixJ family response regulator